MLRETEHRGLAVIAAKRFHHPAVSFDDKVSLAMSAIVDSARSYRPGESTFSTYAMTAIRHRLVNHFTWLDKRRSVLSTFPLDLFDDEDDEKRFASEALTYDEVGYERVDDRLTVDSLLSQLPTYEAAVLRERYLEGREFADIGARRGVSRHSISRTHGRAISALREELRREELVAA